MARIHAAVLIAVGMTALVACGKSSGDGTVAIDMNSAAAAGNVAISVPGFDAKMRVPTGIMGHGDFDIDGVKLYSGSKVSTFNLNVDGSDTRGQKVDRSVIKMGFGAPADVSSVTSWYKAQFAAKSLNITQLATGISGKTRDGGDFLIALAPGASGTTNGMITLIDAEK